MEIKTGDKMRCALLRNGQPSGDYTYIEVLEVRRDPITLEPVSVRVKTLDGNRAARRRRGTVWVQPQYLKPMLLPDYVP